MEIRVGSRGFILPRGDLPQTTDYTHSWMQAQKLLIAAWEAADCPSDCTNFMLPQAVPSTQPTAKVTVDQARGDYLRAKEDLTTFMKDYLELKRKQPEEESAMEPLVDPEPRTRALMTELRKKAATLMDLLRPGANGEQKFPAWQVIQVEEEVKHLLEAALKLPSLRPDWFDPK